MISLTVESMRERERAKIEGGIEITTHVDQVILMSQHMRSNFNGSKEVMLVSHPFHIDECFFKAKIFRYPFRFFHNWPTTEFDKD